MREFDFEDRLKKEIYGNATDEIASEDRKRRGEHLDRDLIRQDKRHCAIPCREDENYFQILAQRFAEPKP